MTTEETKQYLKNYKNMMHRIEYIDNKLINVKSIPYDDSSVGSYAEPKTNNDYIMMKEECKKEMEKIRNTIEKVTTLKYKMALYYKYVDGLTQYDISEIMGKSVGTIWNYLYKGIEELANVLE